MTGFVGLELLAQRSLPLQNGAGERIHKLAAAILFKPSSPAKTEMSGLRLWEQARVFSQNPDPAAFFPVRLAFPKRFLPAAM